MTNFRSTTTNRSFTAIPQIDVGDLIAHGARNATATVARIADAASGVGFFSIVGHGCTQELVQRLIARAMEFFALPLERKMEVYIGRSRNHRGYVPAGEEVFAAGTADKKEAFDVSIELAYDHPAVIGRHLLGPNQWPSLPGFAADVMAYYWRIFDIGRRLMEAFTVALGRAPDHFNPHLTFPPSQLRLIHYPYDAEAQDSPGIGAHTDYECFTLLLSTAPGLEVMNDDGIWIDAPPVPGGLMINIGDMLEILSGGVFVATSHRVRRVTRERYSFPLFFSLDYDTCVLPLAQADSTGNVANRGLVAGEHIFAQTVHTFRYLQERLARGELRMPPGSRPPASFGQQVRHPEST